MLRGQRSKGHSPDHVLTATSGDTLHVLIKQVVYHEVPICIMGGGVVCDAAGWDTQASQHCRVQMEKTIRAQQPHMLV